MGSRVTCLGLGTSTHRSQAPAFFRGCKLAVIIQVLGLGHRMATMVTNTAFYIRKLSGRWTGSYHQELAGGPQEPVSAEFSPEGASGGPRAT